MNYKVVSVLILLASLASAAPTYYLATGQTGAQTQIDVDHTSTWLFTPNVDFDFGGALFTMKAGRNTSEDVLFQLFLGSNSNGQELLNTPLTSSDFCSQVDNCGSFEFHPFFPTLPVSLTAGLTYFAILTSPAPDTQDEAYFIKNNSYFISDINGTPIQPSPIGPLSFSPVAVPEPGTSILMISAGSLLGLRVFRKRFRS